MWKLTPERGTMVMINCLCNELIIGFINAKAYIPAADTEKCK